MSGLVKRRALSAQIALMLCGASGIATAQDLVTRDDWGGVGLLQTPTARMADEGELAFTASRTSPYSRYSVAMQPFPWLEGSFRYMNVTGIRYGAQSFSGNQNYKDKSIDLKLRLWAERRWLPEVAVGLRDIGGTGLFSSEYAVASKRFGPVDASFGLATGYMGKRGDFGNPLGAIDDRFDTRPVPTSAVVNAGKFGASAMFRGRIGAFGGIAYQTPWEPLLLKLEYDGNDYRHEPRRLKVSADTPFNIGAVYTLNPNTQLSLGWERGNTALFALTLHGNLRRATPMAKLLDPAPESLQVKPAAAPAATPHYRDAADKVAATREQVLASAAATDWPAVAARLRANAGIDVESISLRGEELIVSGEQRRYFHPAQGLGRAARVLDNTAPEDFQWFTLVNRRLGMSIAENSVNRAAFADYVQHRTGLDVLARQVEINPPGRVKSEPLYQAPLDRFEGGFGLGYGQILGGPDGFILYQFSADYSAEYRFSRNLWLSGTVSGNLLNNYDKFRYDAPSKLPRVRTYQRQYLTSADVTVPNLQLTASHQFGRDLYGMAYAGLLESMFGGVGGEVLYRPFGQRWAVGANANWVRQRGFRQDASFRDYEVGTGHATLYYGFGREQRVQAAFSAGRYLAGDWGVTANVARLFDNGITMGAYATKTNVSSADFGEGSFDKGIFVSVPMDFLLPRASRSRATLTWSPLTRDGGAWLGRKYGLYGLTSERNTEFFDANLGEIAN
ncbi:YjbH domain-containing protein [Stenotrophomonas sp. YIM B06876]|uniref:YjbH domain-containing protein n=1 Tax=Stenotrophomonas sp. YIM B06876 TaxID=3060211 RepID=UPI002738701E|nr:YjbH domain-containing protein [Stenotrophomonas sp. YIM B06876]